MRLLNRSLLSVGVAAALCLGGAGVAPVGASARGIEATNCTPGYTPCIKNKTSDVDCYGGSGNGPRYTKPYITYKVKRGYDRYRLDADHDGWGCE